MIWHILGTHTDNRALPMESKFHSSAWERHLGTDGTQLVAMHTGKFVGGHCLVLGNQCNDHSPHAAQRLLQSESVYHRTQGTQYCEPGGLACACLAHFDLRILCNIHYIGTSRQYYSYSSRCHSNNRSSVSTRHPLSIDFCWNHNDRDDNRNLHNYDPWLCLVSALCVSSALWLLDFRFREERIFVSIPSSCSMESGLGTKGTSNPEAHFTTRTTRAYRYKYYWLLVSNHSHGSPTVITINAQLHSRGTRQRLDYRHLASNVTSRQSWRY